jgi:hypothetical protein
VASDDRPHGLKYSLFYGRPGERIIAYDNETGKAIIAIAIAIAIVGMSRRTTPLRQRRN